MKNNLPTLYKRSSKGATQQWSIACGDNADGTAFYRVTHGQVNGKMQESEVTVKTGKNLGKANQTTSSQQAQLEAEAKHKKQKDKGYVETLDADKLAAAVAKKPMLAHDFHKYKHQIDWKRGVFVQSKLDGMRCLAHKGQEGVVLFSRMGKTITTVPHINGALAPMMREGEVWDGELYIHGEQFQTLASLIKRAQAGSERVEYHVYDTVEDGFFEFRSHRILERLCDEHSLVVLPVATWSAYSEDDVKERYADFIKLGYEGAIVRANDCEYKEGYRSRELLKVKEFIDQEFEVVDIIGGKGKFENLAIFKLKTDRGATFEAVPRGTEEERRRYYYWGRDHLIGKQVTVRFFEWTTSEPPVPRFPIVTGVRDYE